MNKALFALMLLIAGVLSAQDDEKIAVQKAIETFFDAFHQQDTLALYKSAADTVTLQTIARDSLGHVKVDTTTYEQFVKGITSIPKSAKFEEKLLSFSIQIDGEMANVWTPYEFWWNDVFHHCGVNSFQLVKIEGNWKIVYLIDTRRKKDCS